jgi:hypothetical protein
VSSPGPFVEVFVGRDGRWYGHVKARNGRITDATQGYKQMRSAMRWAARNYPGLSVRRWAG